MNRACETVRDALQAVESGRLDGLSNAQVSSLESHLEDCAACAARLSGAKPPMESSRFAPPAGPSDAEWGAVWDGIESASATTGSRPVRTQLRFVRRFWSVGAAAAALLLAVGLWRVGGLPGSNHTMQLSSNVEVHEIEVFGDATTFVALDDSGGAAMIWVVQDEGA